MSYTYDYPRPVVTADCLIFRKQGTGYEILLIERKYPPFAGQWALPGGFINMDENLENAARRELEEETSLKDIPLKQFYTFGEVDRDPRHRTITVVFYGIADTQNHVAKAGDDAANARWFSLDDIPPLAFDHQQVMDFALEHIDIEQQRHCI